MRWLAGCMGFVWVRADLFLPSVASPFHSFVTTTRDDEGSAWAVPCLSGLTGYWLYGYCSWTLTHWPNLCTTKWNTFIGVAVHHIFRLWAINEDCVLTFIFAVPSYVYVYSTHSWKAPNIATRRWRPCRLTRVHVYHTYACNVNCVIRTKFETSE